MQESSSFSARIRTGVDHLNEATRSFTQVLKLPTGKMRNHTVSQNQTPAAAAASHATHETAQPRISSLTESFSSESVSSQSSFEKLKGRFSLKKPNFQESKVNKLYTESLSSDSSASSKAPDLKPSLLADQATKTEQRLGVPPSSKKSWDRSSLDSAESPAKIPPAERRQIDAFVNAKMNTFKSDKFTRERFDYETSTSKIPLSIEAFKDEAGQLHIMVLCKSKLDNQMIGKGQAKTAKVAVDWTTGEIYANVTVKDPEHMAGFKKECLTMAKLGDKPGIAKPYIGFHEYTSKKVPKMAAFQPLYSGTLDKLSGLDPVQKQSIAKDLLAGLVSLKEAGLEHRDLKPDNILIDRSDGKMGAKIFDLGVARSIAPQGSERNYTTYAKELTEGNEANASPQKLRAGSVRAEQSRIERRYKAEAARLRGTFSGAELSTKLKELAAQQTVELGKAKEAFMDYVDAYAEKNDTWSMGLLLLNLVQPPGQQIDGAIKELFNLQSANNTVLIKEYEGENDANRAHYDDPLQPEHEPLYQKAIDDQLDRLASQLDSTPEKELVNVVRQMLRVNGDERISPQHALELLT